MDVRSRAPHRWRRYLLLLCGLALAAIALWQKPTRPKERATAVEPAAPAAPAPPEPPTVTAGPTAREIADALVAACGASHPDADRIEELRALLRTKGEAEALAATAALLEAGTLKGAEIAWCIAFEVLANEERRITDDEAYAIVGAAATRVFTASETASVIVGGIPLQVYDPANRDTTETRRLAGSILAQIGTPQATQTLLRQLERHDQPATQVIAELRSPASVPLLAEALLRDPDNAGALAGALVRTAEGRAELRRILDPANGYNWSEHGTAKVATVFALSTCFCDAADLVAVDTTLRERGNLVEGVTREMSMRAKSSYPAAMPTRSVQAKAIVAFLRDHPGSPIEEALLEMLRGFPSKVVDPLLPQLGAAQLERVR